MKEAVMGGKSGIISTFLGNVSLQMFAISVHCREYRFVSKWVDTFVHVQCWLRVWDHQCVQISVVDVKAESSTFFHDNNIQWGPFRQAWIDKVHDHHSIYLFLFKFYRFRPWVLWWWVDQLVSVFWSLIWCCIALIEPRCPSKILSDCARILIHLLR